MDYFLIFAVIVIIIFIIAVSSNNKSKEIPNAQQRDEYKDLYDNALNKKNSYKSDLERKNRPHKEIIIMEYEIEYLGGHPLWSNPQKAKLKVNSISKTVEISPRGFLAVSDKIKLSKDEILNVSFERGSSRSLGKAATGAIVGGILTGGVGLLLGGALGAKKKNLSELYIQICYKERDFTVVLKTGKYTDKIYSEINALFA